MVLILAPYLGQGNGQAIRKDYWTTWAKQYFKLLIEEERQAAQGLVTQLQAVLLLCKLLQALKRANALTHYMPNEQQRR